MSDLTLTEAPAALLAFRDVHNPQRALTLAGEKITIGSGLSCTLRITDAGVRPLHCLVTIGQDGLTVRRWSDGTLLNGEVFSESPIGTGDRLTIGPVELELVEQVDAPIPLADVGEGESLLCDVEGWEESAGSDPSTDDEPTHGDEPAAVRAAHNRQRARRLVGRLRETQAEHRLLQASLAELEVRVTGIEAERSSLAHERDELAKRLETLACELTQAQDAYSADRQAYERRESELQERITQLEREIVERNELIEQLKDELLSRYEGSEKSASAAESTVAQAASEEEPASDSDHAASTLLTADIAETAAVAGPDSAPVTPAEGIANDDALFTSNRHEEELSSDTGGVDEHPESASELDHLSEDEPIAPADRWDIEAPTAAETATHWSAEKQAATAVSEAQVPANAELTATDLQQKTTTFDESIRWSDAKTVAELSSDEEDLWGRLQSLRTVACEKLHSEIDGLRHHETTRAGLLAEQLDTLSRAVDVASVETDQQPCDDRLMEHDRYAAIDEAAEHNDTVEAVAADEPTHLTAIDSGDEVARESTPFDPLENEAPAAEPAAPISFVEKYKHLLEEDGSDDSSAGSHCTASAVADPVAKPGRGDTELSISADDESIEDYMAKMLARLRGDSEVPCPPAPTPAPPKSTDRTPCTIPASGTKAEPLASLSDFTAASKPEQSKDISALRDLANNSAREAIKIANCRRAREMAYANLLMSLLAASAGGYLIWTSQGEFNWSLFGGASAVAAAGYWACRTIVSLLPASVEAPTDMPSDVAEQLSLPIAGPEARPQ